MSRGYRLTTSKRAKWRFPTTRESIPELFAFSEGRADFFGSSDEELRPYPTNPSGPLETTSEGPEPANWSLRAFGLPILDIVSQGPR